MECVLRAMGVGRGAGVVQSNCERRCSDKREVEVCSVCLCARPFVSKAESFYRWLCVRRGEELEVVFRRLSWVARCRRW
jgi:hypothetical protein